ncbi:MAG: 50S ribosomal protein L25 [Puniceicoccales bacterium]|jgi:large subunit ribosomal protein L25|nr:50S ribosomal protein L25 [Puniceicoccales bacterium]
MKKQLKLSVKNRDGIGRGPARRLRKAGFIPGIIYGTTGNKPVSVDAIELRTLMRTKGSEAVLVELALEDGSSALSLIRDFQRDPLSLAIVHLDLLSVDPNSEMSASVPIHFTGDAVGVRVENGTLDIMLHEITVRCFPKNLPGSIAVDVSELHVNQSIHIANLPKLDGVVYPGDQTRAVVVCTAQEEEKVEETTAAPAAAEGAAAAPAAGAKPAEGAKPAAAAPAAKPAAAKK